MQFDSPEFVERFPLTAKLNAMLLANYPDQEKFLRRRFSSLDELEDRNLEAFAQQIVDLTGDRLPTFVKDYLFICELQVNEEYHFRRNNNTYRLSTFKEVVEQVYNDKPFMTSYINGLLMTQIWWSNHTKMLGFYKENFLPGNILNYSHLEVGPGHGKLLAMACNDPRAGAIAAWDISPASIESTRVALEAMGVSRMPSLDLLDMFDAEPRQFDSVVFSEVLEHMEEPGAALDVLHSCLSDRGRLFIHVPINSPAPDHLFNMPDPEAMRRFIESRGFEMEDVYYAPLTGYDLDKAAKRALTISCGFIARKA